MGIIENIQLAINSLFSNKMRSILTMLGIIIGIGSVIAIVTVGDSLASSITSEMSGVGARNINIGLEQKNMGEINEDGTYNESEDGIYNPYEIQEKDYITDEMLKDYKAIFKDDIRAISVVEDVGTNKLANGAATETFIASLYPLLYALGLVFNGLVHPNLAIKIIINPIKSIWAAGFKVNLPSNLGVLSPNLSATKAFA